VLTDIPLTAATPASVRAVLWPGDVAETVVVEGAYEMLQTLTATLHQSPLIDEIDRYPLRTHNALDRRFGRTLKPSRRRMAWTMQASSVGSTNCLSAAAGNGAAACRPG
jgi:hypothetical protein